MSAQFINIIKSAFIVGVMLISILACSDVKPFPDQLYTNSYPANFSTPASPPYTQTLKFEPLNLTLRSQRLSEDLSQFVLQRLPLSEQSSVPTSPLNSTNLSEHQAIVPIPGISQNSFSSTFKVIKTVKNTVSGISVVAILSLEIRNGTDHPVRVLKSSILGESGNLISEINDSAIVSPHSEYVVTATPNRQLSQHDLASVKIEWLLEGANQELTLLQYVGNDVLTQVPLLESFSSTVTPVIGLSGETDEIVWKVTNNYHEPVTLSQIWIFDDSEKLLAHIDESRIIANGTNYSKTISLDSHLHQIVNYGVTSEWMIEPVGSTAIICRQNGGQESNCNYFKQIATTQMKRSVPKQVVQICQQGDNGLKASDINRNHTFWGNTYAKLISVWVLDEELARVQTGTVKETGGPYNLTIDLCRETGESLAGERVYFMLDGEWAIQSEILTHNGMHRIDLITEIQEINKDIKQANHSREPIADLYFKRGLIFHKKGKIVEALEDYARSIELEEYSALPYYHRSQIRKAQGDLALFNRDMAHACGISIKVSGEMRSAIFTESYLTKGVPYTFTVTAIDYKGPRTESRYSNPVTYNSLAITPTHLPNHLSGARSGAPTRVKAISDPKGIKVSWHHRNPRGSPLIRNYVITPYPGSVDLSDCIDNELIASMVTK